MKRISLLVLTLVATAASAQTSYDEVALKAFRAEREKMVALTRRTSVPQIFIGATHVGGYDDLMALQRAGELEPLLAGR